MNDERVDVMNERIPNRKNIFSYAIGDLFGGGAFFIIGALFLAYLMDVVGMSGFLAGAIIFVGKIWDAVSDPAMGYISDHTKSKYGRRRPYFLIGIIPIFISWFLLWSDWGITNQVFEALYYFLIYILFNTVFTLVMVPYNAMPAEMTTNYKARSRLIGFRMLCSQIGMLLGALLPLTLVNIIGENSPAGFKLMAAVFGLIFSIPWIFVFFGTYENEVELEEPIAKGTWNVIKGIFRDFASTSKNKALRIHITMYICAYVSMDVFNALLIYFIRDYMDMYTSYQTLLGTVVVIQILSLLLVTKLVNKLGNAMTYRIHASIWIVAILLLFTLNPENPIYLVLGFGAIVGIGLSGCVMTPYNMLAFVVDADEMITTKRRSGVYAGVMTFLRKIAQAIALFLVGVSLDLVGYIQPIDEVTQPQTDGTLLGIRLIFLIVPVTLLIVGIISSIRFKITPQNHKILMSEIERRKHSDTNPSKESKEVCERITGLPYESLWSGDNIA